MVYYPNAVAEADNKISFNDTKELEVNCSAVSVAPASLEQNVNSNCYSIMSTPRNAIELLQNIRYAVDNDLLLRKDFYTLDIFIKFIGADNTFGVYKEPQSDQDKFQIGGRRFGYAVVASATEETTLVGANYGGGWRKNIDANEHSGVLNLGFSRSVNKGAISFEDVEKVFGKKWTLPKEVPVHPPPPSTAKYGNYTLLYRFDDDSFIRIVNIGFDSGGKLRRILVDIKRKSR